LAILYFLTIHEGLTLAIGIRKAPLFGGAKADLGANDFGGLRVKEVGDDDASVLIDHAGAGGRQIVYGNDLADIVQPVNDLSLGLVGSNKPLSEVHQDLANLAHKGVVDGSGNRGGGLDGGVGDDLLGGVLIDLNATVGVDEGLGDLGSGSIGRGGGVAAEANLSANDISGLLGNHEIEDLRAEGGDGALTSSNPTLDAQEVAVLLQPAQDFSLSSIGGNVFLSITYEERAHSA